MKRRYGPNARLEELRILLKECLPFCLYSLTVYFPERKYHDVFSGILKRGKNGNPYKKDDDESDAHEPLMNIEVCSLENMPLAREEAILKEKKKAKQDAEKMNKQQQKKSTNYESDISDWLENAKLFAEEGSCWSDSIDDEVESNCVDLKTIDENDSSIDMCGSKEQMSREKSCVDDLSKDVFSLSMDNKQVAADLEECDSFTISSTDSTFSLDNDELGAAVATNIPERRLKSAQLLDIATKNAPVICKFNSVGSNCDVVDLCNSP
ncbi:hypothetical protein ACHAW5_004993 [Stephanodiscus triporus]|uniref:Uncharacterized protein n=1 Tax=Stephanodiscus triporus TaxID=2934178 RepID=A0ABD3MB92_9STRA